jgi:beta-barrel assembly-enhancing protease
MTQYYGYGYGSGGGSRIHLRTIIGLAVILFGTISYFSHESINPATGERQHVSMTADDEIALGMQAAPQMAAQFGGNVADSDARAQEVSQIGRLIAETPVPKSTSYKFQYHLLSDTQTINAFALPGGQVFITLGLYQKLGDEAELAGVLGHETGHVVERHVAQQIEESRLGQTLAIGSGIVASGQHNGLATWAVADLVNQMVQLRFSREDESQADRCGLIYMSDAQYDPRAMIDVMQILESLAGSGDEPEFFQTHPNPVNRIEAIQKWIDDNPYPANQRVRGDPLPQ